MELVVRVLAEVLCSGAKVGVLRDSFHFFLGGGIALTRP